MSNTSMQELSFSDKLKSGYYINVKLPQRKFGAEERRAISDAVKNNFVGTFQQIQEEIDKKINEAKHLAEEINEKYYQRQRDLMDEFKRDLIADHNLTNHPKADKCYFLAWDLGYSVGLHEVSKYFSELKTLIE